MDPSEYNKLFAGVQRVARVDKEGEFWTLESDAINHTANSLQKHLLREQKAITKRIALKKAKTLKYEVNSIGNSGNGGDSSSIKSPTKTSTNRMSLQEYIKEKTAPKVIESFLSIKNAPSGNITI